MRRTWRGFVALTLAFALVAGACGSDDEEAAPAATTAAPAATTAAPAATTAAPEAVEVKAAFIYVGPVGDAGWTWAHDQGRQFAAEATGV